MKNIIRLVFMVLISGFIVSCGNNKSRNVSASSKIPVTEVNSGEPVTLPDVLSQMQTLNLPLSINNETANQFNGLNPFAPILFDTLPFSPQTYSELEAAKLPVMEDFNPFIVSYRDSLIHPVVELILLNKDSQFTDRTRLFAIEIVSGNMNQRITTESVIDEQFRINITKRLNNTLIESLYYHIATDGTINEIRDGETPVKAFESFDNQTYYVENFVWEPLPTGGVRKKNLVKETYKINNNGVVSKQ